METTIQTCPKRVVAPTTKWDCCGSSGINLFCSVNFGPHITTSLHFVGTLEIVPCYVEVVCRDDQTSYFIGHLYFLFEN